jgi:hypothetical protein
MDALPTLFDRFLRQRRYLKNVTAKTVVWYETAFLALTRSVGVARLDDLANPSCKSSWSHGESGASRRCSWTTNSGSWSRSGPRGLCHQCRLLRDRPPNRLGRTWLFANYGSRRVCDRLRLHRRRTNYCAQESLRDRDCQSLRSRCHGGGSGENQLFGRRRLASPSNSLRVEDCSRPTRPTKISARA